MKVSIIVTCYNLEAYIAECVQSLLDQQCNFDYELLLIDDCSQDSSLEVIKKFHSPKIKLIENKVNKGAAISVTEALAKSSGEYLCRFDGDDKWPPDFLQTTVDVLDKHADVDMVYGDVAFIDSNSAVSSAANNINRRDKQQPVLENEFADILRLYYINAPTIMFRKDAFAKAFPLPQFLIKSRNFIDWFISLTVLHSGKAYFINKPIAYYRLHATNNHRAIVLNRLGEEVTEFVLNYFVPASEAIMPLAKKQIFADNYFVVGEQYFGRGMYEDAKRMYKKIIQCNPLYLTNVTFVKHWLGCLVGKKTYERTRSVLGNHQAA